MRITDSPEALPGSCKLCGSGTKAPFIDFGLSEEFYGAWYLCEECYSEGARLLGYLPPVEALALETKYIALLEEKFQLLVKVSGLEQAIDGLRIARDSIPSDISDRPDSISVSLFEADEESQGGENLLGSGEGETSEPSDDKGLGELHSDDGANASPEFRLSF